MKRLSSAIRIRILRTCDLIAGLLVAPRCDTSFGRIPQLTSLHRVSALKLRLWISFSVC